MFHPHISRLFTSNRRGVDNRSKSLLSDDRRGTLLRDNASKSNQGGEFMTKQCVKCGYVRSSSETAPEIECPKCGVIYAKVEAMAAAEKLSATRSREVKPKITSTPPKKVLGGSVSDEGSKRGLIATGIGFAILLALTIVGNGPIFLIFSPLLYFVYRKFSAPSPERTIARVARLVKESDADFSVTRSLFGLGSQSGILLDEPRKKVFMFEENGQKVGVYNEANVLSCEVVEDGSTVLTTNRGIGKAALGGLAFGGV
ncbi:MAG: hypothetical protein RJA34_2147, partial [Pseudomonadota bacterium]